MISVLNKLFMANKTYKLSSQTLAIRHLNTPARETQMISNDDFSTDMVWMDLEMTGLDIKKDKILEVSCLITDKNLNVIAEGPCFAVNHPEHIFQHMSDWCKKHHYKSGLVDNCLKSQVTNNMGEQMILNFFKQHIPKGKCPLAGSSVYMDRLFLQHLMPSVNDYMHYRNIDVSSIKELARRWNPNLFDSAPTKRFTHRSLEDIYDSIAELKFYRDTFFKTLSDVSTVRYEHFVGANARPISTPLTNMFKKFRTLYAYTKTHQQLLRITEIQVVTYLLIINVHKKPKQEIEPLFTKCIKHLFEIFSDTCFSNFTR